MKQKQILGNGVKDIGKSSIEWYNDGKPQYYCFGYIDRRTDELIDECKRCKRQVYKAQEDLENYLNSKKLGGTQ